METVEVDHGLKMIGGLHSNNKSVTFYFHRLIRFKQPQTKLLDLEPGWYAYEFRPDQYLFIEVKNLKEE